MSEWVGRTYITYDFGIAKVNTIFAVDPPEVGITRLAYYRNDTNRDRPEYPGVVLVAALEHNRDNPHVRFNYVVPEPEFKRNSFNYKPEGI
jgi:hypothetical protein